MAGARLGGRGASRETGDAATTDDGLVWLQRAVRAAAAGDSGARGYLYARCADDLYTTLVRSGVDEERSLALTVEAFSPALLRTYDEMRDGSFSGWLAGLTTLAA